MRLGEKQELFAEEIIALMRWANIKGYKIRLGDAFRDPRVHGKMGVKKGYGRANSCHKLKLAQDINLFMDGEWLKNTEGHRVLGEHWESMGEFHSWGGRFNDGNHYSFEHNGFR